MKFKNKMSKLHIYNGAQEWWQNDKFHRLYNGPAATYRDGTFEWFVNGEYHREGGPAVLNIFGNYFWYTNGKITKILFRTGEVHYMK